LKGDRISENQYISDYDEPTEAEPLPDLDNLSDDNISSEIDDTAPVTFSSQSNFTEDRRNPKLSQKGRLIKPVSRYSP
jgi:hypothetical protein